MDGKVHYDRNKRSFTPLKFTYLTDELGHILETREQIDTAGTAQARSTLGGFARPMMPKEVGDDEKKRKQWLEYWDKTTSWWEQERMHESRSKW